MNRSIDLAALNDAKKFGQAIVTEVEGGAEKCLENRVGRIAKLIESHSVGHDGVVMRPHGAPMITEGIENALLLGKGAPSPPGKHVGPHEALTHGACPLLCQHARKKKMPRIRGDHLNLAFAAVERQGVKTSARHPKRLFETPRH